jgi:hypothetical protein
LSSMQSHKRTKSEDGRMSRTKMTQKQMTLAITARDNPQHRFTNLYSLMHWDYWIESAAAAVLARPGSSTAGVDGKTRDAFLGDYDGQMARILQEMKSKTYQPLPVHKGVHTQERRAKTTVGHTSPKGSNRPRGPKSGVGSDLRIGFLAVLVRVSQRSEHDGRYSGGHVFRQQSDVLLRD